MSATAITYDMSKPESRRAMQQDALRQIQALPHKGVYSFEVKRRRLDKTQAQLGYYWGHVVQVLAKYLECEPEQAHHWIGVYTAYDIVPDPITGEAVRHPKPLSGGDRIDLMQRIDAARDWMLAELGLVTLDPDPSWRETQPKH